MNPQCRYIVDVVTLTRCNRTLPCHLHPDPLYIDEHDTFGTRRGVVYVNDKPVNGAASSVMLDNEPKAKTVLDILTERIECEVDKKERSNDIYYGEWGITREQMREQWTNEVIDGLLNKED